MAPEPLEQVVGNIDAHVKNIGVRLTHVEQILPTLATTAELKEAIAPLATKFELREATSEVKAELRVEIREEGERTRRHFDVIAEGFRRDFRQLARFGLCLLFCLGATLAAAQQIPSDLERAMRVRTDAAAKPDPVVWEQLTTEDFTVLSGGRLLNKAERLAELRKQPPATDRQPREHERITVHGDTAIERYRRGRDWILHVWVRTPKGWQTIATQVTSVAAQ